jgi:PAS domain S-box-containing protein
MNDKDFIYRSIFDSTPDGLIITDLESGIVLEADPAACLMHGYSRQEFIGIHISVFINPDSQYLFTEYVQIFQSGGVFDTRVQHVRRDGSTFYAEWRGTVFTYQGHSCFLSVVRDVSSRIKAEQYLHKRIDTHSQEQAKLLEISHTLASTLEFKPGLILDQLREIIEYNKGGLFALEDSALVTLAMRGGPQFNDTNHIRLHLKGPEMMDALFNGHLPILIANIWDESPQAQFLRLLLDDGAAILLEGMQSWMWVPLAVKNRIIGGIGVANGKPDYFTLHHASLALSAANQVAITMVNVELYEQAKTLAVFEERQRLARNLHDAVNQSLFSAGLIAEVLPRLWEQDQAEARQSIKDLLHLTRGAQAEMRALLAELRPSTLTDSNLGDLLHQLANGLIGRTNIEVTVTVEEDFILPAEVQIVFYRVCQEALLNVAKHAKAHHVEIGLRQEDGTIIMFIDDDGQGFNVTIPKQQSSGHYGLSIMNERAQAVGAQLSINSQPGQGTDIILRWAKTSIQVYS